MSRKFLLPVAAGILGLVLFAAAPAKADPGPVWNHGNVRGDYRHGDHDRRDRHHDHHWKKHHPGHHQGWTHRHHRGHHYGWANRYPYAWAGPHSYRR